MSLLSLLFGDKKKTASVAKERLQIILAHERSGIAGVARSKRGIERIRHGTRPGRDLEGHVLQKTLIAAIRKILRVKIARTWERALGSNEEEFTGDLVFIAGDHGLLATRLQVLNQFLVIHQFLIIHQFIFITCFLMFPYPRTIFKRFIAVFTRVLVSLAEFS